MIEAKINDVIMSSGSMTKEAQDMANTIINFFDGSELPLGDSEIDPVLRHIKYLIVAQQTADENVIASEVKE